MFGKVILSLTFLVLASVEIAANLWCLTCVDPEDCKDPNPIECSPMWANVTSDNLKPHYSPDMIKELNTNDFSCFVSNYFEENTNITRLDIRGCIMNGLIDCNAKPQNTSLTEDYCDVCTTNNCNTRTPIGNSVGTYSLNMFGLISLLFAKALVAFFSCV